MGEAVPAFVLANGPAKITNYNFLKIKGATINTALVVHRPVEGDLPPSHSQQKHDLHGDAGTTSFMAMPLRFI